MLPSLVVPDLESWIAGRAETSGRVDDAFLHDPNSGEVMQQSRSSSPEQVDRAIAAADRAHQLGAWEGAGTLGRQAALDRLADQLDLLAPQIALLDSLNSGVPITTMRLFAGDLGATVRSAAQRAVAAGESVSLPSEQGGVELRRRPWGPVALITPWNAPAGIAVKKLAYALAAGATVVLKPSPASPWSAQLIAFAVAEAGIPAGVVNVVLGGSEVGSQLVSDPRIRAIAMTGSTSSGRAIATAAAGNFTRMNLELGSNNPAIVRADADLELTASRLAEGMTKLSGQWCEAPRRVIVDVSLADELADEVARRLSELTVGSSLSDSSDVGPMAFSDRRTELERQRTLLMRDGILVPQPADVPDDGWFFAPSVVRNDADAVDSELFGPLLVVETSTDDEDAVRRANTGQVGLAGYVFGRDLDRAREVGARIHAGEIKLNGTSILDMAPDSAQSFFGGSGLGGHGDADLLDFFLGKQVIGTDRPGVPI